MMHERGLAEEVAYAAQIDLFDVVPKFEAGRLRPATPVAPPAPVAVPSSP
jgi:phosphosulfolactate phosphohydrolase-like enzyme